MHIFSIDPTALAYSLPSTRRDNTETFEPNISASEMESSKSSTFDSDMRAARRLRFENSTKDTTPAEDVLSSAREVISSARELSARSTLGIRDSLVFQPDTKEGSATTRVLEFGLASGRDLASNRDMTPIASTREISFQVAAKDRTAPIEFATGSVRDKSTGSGDIVLSANEKRLQSLVASLEEELKKRTTQIRELNEVAVRRVGALEAEKLTLNGSLETLQSRLNTANSALQTQQDVTKRLEVRETELEVSNSRLLEANTALQNELNQQKRSNDSTAQLKAAHESSMEQQKRNFMQEVERLQDQHNRELTELRAQHKYALQEEVQKYEQEKEKHEQLQVLLMDGCLLYFDDQARQLRQQRAAEQDTAELQAQLRSVMEEQVAKGYDLRITLDARRTFFINCLRVNCSA